MARHLTRRRSRRSRRRPAAVWAALLVLIGVVLLAPRAGAAVEGGLQAPHVESRTLRLSRELRVASVPPVSPTRRSDVSPTAGQVVTLDPGRDFTMLGLRCDPPAQAGEVVLRLRTSIDRETWSPWYEAPLELAAQGEGGPRAFTEAVWTGEARYAQLAAQAATGEAPVALSNVSVVALDTQGAEPPVGRGAALVRRLASLVGRLQLTEAAAAAAEPAIVSRAAWGADESLRTGAPVLAPVKMAFIHHTGGGGAYTQAEAPGIVRGIYAYHTQSLGWSDIGYNFLVDRFGTIYEGRFGGIDQGVVGAQVYGFNTGSTGVAVIGAYTDEAPPAAARASLERLLAWKLALHGVDPLGAAQMTCGAGEKYRAGETVQLPAIAGHRDANFTACPGDALYGWLPAARTSIAALIGAADAPAAPLPKWRVTLTLRPSQITAGERVTLRGAVANAAGQAGTGTVTLQKRPASGGAWTSWRTVALGKDGSYSASVRMTVAQTAQVRARMAGTSANAAGFSSTRTVTVAAPPASLAAEPPAPAAEAAAETAFTISGRGWGHGIGMSQWGAYGFAKRGATYREILKHYYTGIGFSEVGNPTLRVLLRAGLKEVKVSCRDPFTVRAAAAAVTLPAGATATTTLVGGKYRVVAGAWSRDFASPVTFAATSGCLSVLSKTDAGVTGEHRGTIKLTASGASLLMVNHVALESYLRGVVPHEMSASWPAEALKAQACAARAYAVRARGGDKPYDLFCDVRSQVYSGTAREDARSDAAVKATAGVVPSVDGQPIQAFYFASSGGRTENIELAWQTSPVSYLKSVPDPYDDAAPLHAWGPLRRTPAELEAALGAAVKGSLLAVCRVERGVSPRIVKAAVVGSEGTTYLHGSTLRAKLGLNSAWATLKSVSIAPAAAEKTVVAAGEAVALQGRIVPALPTGATVKLYANSDGVWRSRELPVSRASLSLPDGSTLAYSAYQVTVAPAKTTRYYVLSGNATSPVTTIAVRP